MRLRIGELLIQAGALTRDQLGDALRHQARQGGRLGTALVALGLVDERRLCQVLSSQLRIPAVGAEQLERTPAATLGRVPAATARKLRAVPVREDAGKLWVALAEPTDPDVIDELWRASGMPVRAMVAPERVILEAIDRAYGAEPQRPEPAPVALTGAMKGPVPVVRVDEPSAPGLEELTGFLDEAPRAAAKRAVKPMSREQLIARLAAATQEEPVLLTALEFVAQHVGGAALFLLRSGDLTGYNAIGLDGAATRSLRAPLAELPLAQQACTSGETFLGVIAPASLGRLAAALGVTSELLAVLVPVRLARRPVGLIVGVDLAHAALAHRDDLARLPAKTDHALHIVHLRRQLLAP